MLRNVKNYKEIQAIEDRINKDPLCLSVAMFDARKNTHDLVNNLEPDDCEELLLNDLEVVLITELKKDKISSFRTYYKINMILQCKNDNYTINDWFTMDKELDMFNASDVVASWC